MSNRYVVHINGEYFKSIVGEFEAQVVNVSVINAEHDLEFTLNLIPPPLPIPSDSQTKFYVFYIPYQVYTTIGAENIHHATNKAAKLFKDKWTGVSKEQPSGKWWNYVSIPQFNDIINR